MMINNFFDNVIIGAGIAGCSTAYFLSQHTNSLLLIDKNSDVAQGASGAAGAFLSPLLGKSNNFKDLITKSLNFSIDFYKNFCAEDIINCGVCRIPKNQEDEEKFQSYIPTMDFEFKKFEDGYFFEIGSVVNPYKICKKLTKNINIKFDYEVFNIKKDGENWLINDEIYAKNIILATGADISLIEEKYFDIRAVWGQKIDILSTTKVDINYHKECSLSISTKSGDKNLISIGATHHRFTENIKDSSYNLKLKNINKIEHNSKTQEIINQDNLNLLKLANGIKKLENVEIINAKIGARASSVDYFPMIGELVDSKNSIEKFPHIKNGSHIKDENLSMIENLYVINGVGGRGFVLSPYLAFELTQNIISKKELHKEITTHRLFKRWAKKLK